MFDILLDMIGMIKPEVCLTKSFQNRSTLTAKLSCLTCLKILIV